ncbi:MAG TPA: phage baseplate assembly protein V [Pyrinomonadaceae bacterium]|nr:phage baseplate assembly protein V [Pyrinomonadaceae bacterium]
MNDELLTRLVERVESRFYGKYRAFVVDNADPEKRGRLRVKVPSVLGDEVVSGWALPCAPYGGAPDEGFFFIPPTGAGVWVEFEAGNLEYPVWVGAFWSKPGGEPETPKINAADGSKQDTQHPPTRKILKTQKGHTLQFEDADDDEMILLVEAKNGHVVSLNKDGIKTTDGANGHEVFLDSSGVTVTDGVNGGNKITLSSGGVTVEDKNGNKITMGAGSVEIVSTSIKLGGAAAIEPMVLGLQFQMAVQQFLTMLATHTHVGNLGAPTSPPVTPMLLNVPLSAKHKVE